MFGNKTAEYRSRVADKSSTGRTSLVWNALDKSGPGQF
jgi:hypothetical protein